MISGVWPILGWWPRSQQRDVVRDSVNLRVPVDDQDVVPVSERLMGGL